MALRVLCVDDDDRLFELLATYFRDNAVELVHAADGRRGLAARDGGVFDAGLPGVMMPGPGGGAAPRRASPRRRCERGSGRTPTFRRSS